MSLIHNSKLTSDPRFGNASCLLLPTDSPGRVTKGTQEPIQFTLKSPQWQRKSPSEIQQQLNDRLAAAAHRRSLRQVEKKAKHARAQADREVQYVSTESCV